MTGLYPSAHKTVTASVSFPETMTGHVTSLPITTDVLPPNVTTLAEAFHSGGYRTLGFTANPFLIDAFGFARGFDTFEFFPGPDFASADHVVDETLEQVAKIEQRPMFLWVHRDGAAQSLHAARVGERDVSAGWPAGTNCGRRIDSGMAAARFPPRSAPGTSPAMTKRSRPPMWRWIGCCGQLHDVRGTDNAVDRVDVGSRRAVSRPWRVGAQHDALRRAYPRAADHQSAEHVAEDRERHRCS